MKTTALTIFLYIAVFAAGMAAAPTLSVSEWTGKGLTPWPSGTSLSKAGRISRGEVDVTVTSTRRSELEEWRVAVENKGTKLARLRFRLTMPGGGTGGAFWDGFKINTGVAKDVLPTNERYIFPAVAYANGGELSGIGYAPMTLSSRFERGCLVNNDKVTLFFDSYMALEPGQKDEIYFISYQCRASDYTELLEQIYLAYPDWFHPVKGADSRIYGVGGYFFSSDESREYQMEEARRYGFNWEWYYNCYQKSGDFYPSQKFWEEAKGYKSEAGSLVGKCDRPGTIEDWKNYNNKRIAAGNKSAAMFYYYLQQYCSSELLQKDYAKAIWRDKNGNVPGPVFGWADEGNAQYAWPLHSKLGDAIRQQLAMVWRDFPLAGFALDCALGHTRYYGPLLKHETGKAFDDQGRVYATEGIALAYNLDFTHSLPAKPDGRKAASVINEFYTWLPMFHADGGIHEMTPFDRSDLLAPRRFIAGQKPYFFWKGFRIDALLKWDELSDAEVREGLTGIVDHAMLSSLRFGIIPAVFYLQGFGDIKDLVPLLKTMLKAGWRAASYVSIEGREAPADPFGINEEIWISRYGDGVDSYIVLSVPDKKGMRGKAIIHTGKFGASGAIYVDVKGRPVVNEVKSDRTIVDFDLKNREPLILREIAVVKPADCRIEASCSVKVPGREQVAKFQFLKQSAVEVQMAKDWVRKSASDSEVVFAKAPAFRFLPDDKFVADIVLGDNKKADAAIAVSKEDLSKYPDAVKLLEIYYDYYVSRRARPVHRVAAMKPYWNKNLRLPVLSPDSAELKNAKVVFVVGDGAVKALMSGADYSDAVFGQKRGQQLLIGFFPGKNMTLPELVLQMLDCMDEKYPFDGGIKATWALKAKLYGKVFRKE